MAWNALTGQFRRKDEDTKRESELFGSRPAGGSAGVGGGEAPSANPLGGFGGTAGSAGAPTSSRFVNYGTLYGANEEKAKQMANNVYRGAEKKAEDAKKTVADAQQSFAAKAAANAGNWRPIGGAHGTRIESGVGSASAGADQAWGSSYYNGDTGQHKQGLEGGVGGTRGLSKPGASANSAGASRYASLYGAPAPLAEWSPDAAEAAKDYHHSVRPLDAKSGAGQDYTGPESLKESMGDEAYADAAEQIRKAGEDIGGLSDAGGIAEALGYQGTEGDGMASMDAGLTQTAGQSNFKRLAERYGGLGKTLTDAQTNSIADAGRADAASDVAAADWDALLKEFEAREPEKDPNAPITIDAAQGESTGDRVGQNTDKPGQMGANTSARTGEISGYGYDQQDINDIWDQLTDEEKDWFNTDPIADGAYEDTRLTRLRDSILAKLKAHKGGG